MENKTEKPSYYEFHERHPYSPRIVWCESEKLKCEKKIKKWKIFYALFKAIGTSLLIFDWLWAFNAGLSLVSVGFCVVLTSVFLLSKHAISEILNGYTSRKQEVDEKIRHSEYTIEAEYRAQYEMEQTKDKKIVKKMVDLGPAITETINVENENLL